MGMTSGAACGVPASSLRKMLVPLALAQLTDRFGRKRLFQLVLLISGVGALAPPC